jgi:hypothetical protein
VAVVAVAAVTTAPRRRGPVDAPREAAPPAAAPREARAEHCALLVRRFHASVADPSPDRLAALRCAVTTLVDRLRSAVTSAAEVVEYVSATVLPPANPVRRALDAPTEETRVRQQALEWRRGAYRDDAWW